VTCTEKWEAFS